MDRAIGVERDVVRRVGILNHDDDARRTPGGARENEDVLRFAVDGRESVPVLLRVLGFSGL